ncbi:MAG: hypothetical protein UY77_C0009G0004 [Candidatus Uhrbacteria bacterium GW2011_GWA2_53_10]|uniref:Uncharacterized protein n=1 Tax=Candidatus Uhrbacteria bacterium GW2011_GWA2_53_10 TaxID=1618980 RepID=A0A0G1XPR7_9BACT|nr:MAG: hypothetical protein UY77_C0009G0004 [Candidatus Uhrbacteria bacterium GW2011_GWA2_53_10]
MDDFPAFGGTTALTAVAVLLLLEVASATPVSSRLEIIPFLNFSMNFVRVL